MTPSTVKQIVATMTLEKKASLVVGTGLCFGGNGPVVGEADGKVPGAEGNTMNISRLGVPVTVLADGPAGVRIDPVRKEDNSKTFKLTNDIVVEKVHKVLAPRVQINELKRK